MSIGVDGTVCSEWAGDGIDSTADIKDDDPMTDAKYTPLPEADRHTLPTIGEMIQLAGARKTFQWLSTLINPEFAKAALFEWLQASPPEPTNPFNPSAMPHYMPTYTPPVTR